MLTTKRKPATVGEILTEEFMEPMALTQAALAEAMGVQRKHVNDLCNDRRNVTAATALILARVFGNSPDFWLNVQRRGDLWEAMHSPKERERMRIEGGRYRREHLWALAQRVEVADKEFAFIGSKSDLLRTLAAASGAGPAFGLLF